MHTSMGMTSLPPLPRPRHRREGGEMNAARPMTLDEYMSELPQSHPAKVEYDAILNGQKELVDTLRDVLHVASVSYNGDAWYFENCNEGETGESIINRAAALLATLDRKDAHADT